jgi:ppGpp synthetase/RelA/SpoT-type nucleotidyltranferase
VPRKKLFDELGAEHFLRDGERAKVRDEVLEHLARNGDDYRQAVQQLRLLFEEFRNSKEGKRVLYRVATRKDNQDGGDELKSVRSIVDKIIARREELQADGKKADYEVNDVEDIIGMQLVCVYPSDVDAIVGYVHELDIDMDLDTVAPFAEVHKPSGYRALHGVVAARNGLKCEIQILTLLQEAWSCKTHALTYKGHNIVAADSRDTALLSDALWNIDRQSEALKDKIDARSRDSDIERSALVRTHLVNIFNGPIELRAVGLDEKYSAEGLEYDNVSAEDGMLLLRYLVQCSKDDLLAETTRVKTAELVLSEADRYARHFSLFGKQRAPYELLLYFSRIYALAAFCLERQESIGKACYYAHQIKEHARKHAKRHQTTALIHEGWTYFCAGELDDAIAAMKDAVDGARTAKTDVHLEMGLNDLAYFVACLLDRNYGVVRGRLTRDERSALSALAHESILEAISSAGERLTGPGAAASLQLLELQFGDTQGYLRIVTGATEDTIQEGIEQCARLGREYMKYDKPMHDLVRMYSRIHVRRGWRRLLELTTSRPSH